MILHVRQSDCPPDPHHRVLCGAAAASPKTTSARPCARCASPCSRRMSRLPVIKTFIDAVKAKALGAEVASSLTPGQAFIGILHRRARPADGRCRARASTCARSRRSWCSWQACRVPVRPPLRPSWRGWLIEREKEARPVGQHGRAPPGRDAAARAPCRSRSALQYFAARAVRRPRTSRGRRSMRRDAVFSTY